MLYDRTRRVRGGSTPRGSCESRAGRALRIPGGLPPIVQHVLAALEELPGAHPLDGAAPADVVLRALAAAGAPLARHLAAMALAAFQQAFVASGADAAGVLAVRGEALLGPVGLAADLADLALLRQLGELLAGRGRFDRRGRRAAGRAAVLGLVGGTGGQGEGEEEGGAAMEGRRAERSDRGTHGGLRQKSKSRTRLKPRRTSRARKPPAKSPPSIWSTVVARELPRTSWKRWPPSWRERAACQAVTLPLRSRSFGTTSSSSRLPPGRPTASPAGTFQALRRRGVSRSHDGASRRSSPGRRRCAMVTWTNGRVRSATPCRPRESTPARRAG